MADEVRDALMMLTIKGTPVPAEGTAVIGSNDALSKGFVPGTKDNKWQGNFFAVTDYDFNIKLQPDTDNDPAVIAKKQAETLKLMKQQLNEQQKGGKGGSGSNSLEFARFMDMPPGGTLRAYPSSLEPVEITKQLDVTSLRLVDACTKSTTFDSAVLIKRRGGGSATLGTYLRFDFTDLLITALHWEEDDVVTEKVTFVCRKVEVQYRVELPNGDMGAPLPKQTWSVLNLKS